MTTMQDLLQAFRDYNNRHGTDYGVIYFHDDGSGEVWSNSDDLYDGLQNIETKPVLMFSSLEQLYDLLQNR